MCPACHRSFLCCRWFALCTQALELLLWLLDLLIHSFHSSELRFLARARFQPEVASFSCGSYGCSAYVEFSLPPYPSCSHLECPSSCCGVGSFLHILLRRRRLLHLSSVFGASLRSGPTVAFDLVRRLLLVCDELLTLRHVDLRRLLLRVVLHLLVCSGRCDCTAFCVLMATFQQLPKL